MQKHHLPSKPLILFPEGTNVVYSYDNHLVIKLFPPFHQDQFEKEQLVLKKLAGKLSVSTPILKAVGNIEGWPYIIMTQLEGTLLETLWDTLDYNNQLIIIKELGLLIREVHALPTQGLESIDCHWEKWIKTQIQQCEKRHQDHHLPIHLLQQIPNYIDQNQAALLKIKTPVLLTGEYTPMNFLVKNIKGIWHISSLIDFGDAMLGHAYYDLLGPATFIIQGNKKLSRAFLHAYGFSDNEMNASLSQQLTALLLLHQYSHLKVQIRIAGWENKVNSLEALGKLIFGF